MISVTLRCKANICLCLKNGHLCVSRNQPQHLLSTHSSPIVELVLTVWMREMSSWANDDTNRSCENSPRSRDLLCSSASLSHKGTLNPPLPFPNSSTNPLNPPDAQNLTAPHSTLPTALLLTNELVPQPPPQVPQPFAEADAR